MFRASQEWVRGGQTTQHWTKMATQVVIYSCITGAIIYFASFLLMCYRAFTFAGLRLSYVYKIAEFNVTRRGNEVSEYRYLDDTGAWVTRTFKDIYLDPVMRSYWYDYNDMAEYYSLISFIPALVAVAGSILIFAIVGRNLNTDATIRGAELLKERQLRRWMQRKWDSYYRDHGVSQSVPATIWRFVTGGRAKAAERMARLDSPVYSVGGIPYPPNGVQAQTFFTGTVGAGKTTFVHELLLNIRAQKGRAIIYDRTGSLVEKHYNPDTDIIVNPFDKRSKTWTPFKEVKDTASFPAIAEVMIPTDRGATDPFWTQTARLVFAHACSKLYRKHGTKARNAMLRQAILEMPNEELAKLVEGTPAAHMFGENVAKTSGSIRANLVTVLAFLEYLRDDGDPFSIRDWVMNEDGQEGFIFLTANAEQAAACRNIISTMLEVASNALMTCSESRHPRVWFLIDEIPSLNRLPFLTQSLAEIRKFGGAFCIGWQVFSQMVRIYGEEDSQTIAGVCNNRIFYNTPDFDTAKMASQSIGERDLIMGHENLSMGADSQRDGVTIISQRTTQALITPSELQNLPQLTAVVAFAYDAPAARVKFKYIDMPTKEPAFEPIDDGVFATGEMTRQLHEQDPEAAQELNNTWLSLTPAKQNAAFDKWVQDYGLSSLLNDAPELRGPYQTYFHSKKIEQPDKDPPAIPFTALQHGTHDLPANADPQADPPVAEPLVDGGIPTLSPSTKPVTNFIDQDFN